MTHILLNQLGVPKRAHADFDVDVARRIYVEQIVPAAQSLNEPKAA